MTDTPSGYQSALSERQFRRLDQLVFISLVVLTLLHLVYVLFAPLDPLTFRTSDDAFYYFNVARNVVMGQGLTFDGINPTNGFHPLWMLIVVAVYAPVSADPVMALRTILVFVTLLAGLGAFVAYISLRSYGGQKAAAATLCFLLSPFALNPLLNGLESGLLLFLLFVLLWAFKRWDLANPLSSVGQDLFLGALLSAIILTRLDSVFLLFSVVVLICLRSGFPATRQVSVRLLARKLAIVGGVIMVLVLPYVVWNLVSFGHLMPISGAVKSGFPEIFFTWRRLAKFATVFGAGQLGVSLLFLLFLLPWTRERSSNSSTLLRSIISSPTSLLLALWFASALHFMNTLLFMRWGVTWWHYTSYLPMTLTLFAMGLDRYVIRGRWSTRRAFLAAAVALIFSLTTLALDARKRGERHRHWFEAALWAEENLPADAVVGMTDCGIFGYFSDRPTVNLDGVINGYAYQEALRDRRLSEYLDRCGVTHIAAHEVRYREEVYLIPLISGLYPPQGGAILGVPEAEVFRSAVHRDLGGKEVRFVIWDRDKLEVLDDLSDAR
jgi:hypothetical protein